MAGVGGEGAARQSEQHRRGTKSHLVCTTRTSLAGGDTPCPHYQPPAPSLTRPHSLGLPFTLTCPTQLCLAPSRRQSGPLPSYPHLPSVLTCLLGKAKVIASTRPVRQFSLALTSLTLVNKTLTQSITASRCLKVLMLVNSLVTCLAIIMYILR